MFIGHLPAGYILTETVQEKFKTSRYLLIGLIASVLPDIDVPYFYFVDHQQNLHHGYWIHIPFYWLIIASITFFVIWALKKKAYMVAAIIFFSNIFLHLFLDTIVGKIEWLYPFSDKSFAFFEVPAVYDWWVYNFVFHWTFLFEMVVIIWAIFILIRRRNKQKIRARLNKHL